MQHNSISERINLLRPMLIFLIATTHIPGNLYRPDLKDISLSGENFLHALLSGVIAVSALPLLSIISGYLAAHTYQKYRYQQTLIKKVQRLLIPMLVWNLLMGVYIYQQQAAGIAFRADLQLYPFSSFSLLNWGLGLTALFKLPMNPPLYFLRELFICFLLLPLLYRISTHKLITLLFVAVIAGMSVFKINLYFFHRIDIYGFFVIGLFLSNHRTALAGLVHFFNKPWVQAVYIGGFIGCALLLTAYSFLPSHRHFMLAIKISTLLSPLAFWMLSQYIRGSGKVFLLWLSPLSFTVFLGHVPIFLLSWELWLEIFGINPLQQYYWLYWLSSLLMCFIGLGLLHFGYRKLLIGIKLIRSST